MEWSIQVATGYQRAINWQGVEMAIKSLLDLYIGPRLIGQLVVDTWKQKHHPRCSTMVGWDGYLWVVPGITFPKGTLDLSIQYSLDSADERGRLSSVYSATENQHI